MGGARVAGGGVVGRVLLRGIASVASVRILLFLLLVFLVVGTSRVIALVGAGRQGLDWGDMGISVVS